MRHIFTAASILILSLSACSQPREQRDLSEVYDRVYTIAKLKLPSMDILLDERTFPRTLAEDGSLVTSDVKWWCSGFYPGCLWLLYEQTSDPNILSLAHKNTQKLLPLLRTNTDHDIGFQLMCSFGQGWRLTQDREYLAPLIVGAKKLSSRFNEKTLTIRSWDFGQWEYPVIIDNMMNLELLTFAARANGGPVGDSLRNVAITHAQTTMKNHFREDFSSYHLVDYSTEDGHVLGKQTVQGYGDTSSWARGQAWALYGYTMMGRECAFWDDTAMKGKDFLRQAENIARMLLDRLPEDGIPYWDFDAPVVDGKEPLRDASAGAVMASAFAELSTLTTDKDLRERCLDMAALEVTTLAGEEYLPAPGQNGCFLLRHSVGNIPGGTEIDVPLTYADYYFLEALSRLRKILK